MENKDKYIETKSKILSVKAPNGFVYNVGEKYIHLEDEQTTHLSDILISKDRRMDGDFSLIFSNLDGKWVATCHIDFVHCYVQKID